ncbi:hypothetical protein [Christiangramia sediminis]|uniref:Uncharacterized protein n=1 Tax=Christiangramia sediminis TaxID=2881336 RepID=A0A9X1LHK4_9FLAO|nr:hypothetical protein [Christiangramia sediminis]MCB7480460.1 hypothetical protein [Christiangramia sediminis]
MYKSKEIRWFSRTEDQSISRWFEENGFTFENSDARTDYYLPLQNQNGIGIKLREGYIEIKQLISRSDREKLAPSVKGYFEHYIKWSFTSAEEDPLFDEIIKEEKYSWLAVRKERIGFKLKENQNGSIIRVKMDEYPDFGCQVEYTRLKVKDELWYTLGLEWFGEKELKFDFSLLNKIFGDQQLEEENSMGYSAFLNRFQAPEVE